MRLWALQVLSGSQYAAKAKANQIRNVQRAGSARHDPRLERHVLVTNQPVTSVELSLSGLPRDHATG